jgi:hypothetical protein
MFGFTGSRTGGWFPVRFRSGECPSVCCDTNDEMTHLKEHRVVTIHSRASRRLAVIAVFTSVFLGAAAEIAVAAPPVDRLLGGRSGSVFIALAKNTPSLADRDRVLFQGLIGVTLALTLAVLVQSRILDAKEEAPMPEWVRRFVPIADVFVTSIMAGIGATVIALALAVLSTDKPLTADERTYLSWVANLVALLALWVFAVAVWRRILPVLWRRPSDQPWRLKRDWIVETMVLVWPPLGVYAGFSLLAKDASGGGSLVALAAVLAAELRWTTWGTHRREAKRLKTLVATRNLRLGEAHLAGFAEPETPRVEVLRAPEAPDVWLTFTQAKDVVAAFDWGKRNIKALDDRHVRLRSVEFENKWYRGWWRWNRRQVFGLCIKDRQGPPTKLESDESQVLCVRSVIGLFVPEPAVFAGEKSQCLASPSAIKSLRSPARWLLLIGGMALIFLARWSDRGRHLRNGQ